jgi:hypothetical protein
MGRGWLAIPAPLVALGYSGAKQDNQTKPTFDWPYPQYSQYDAAG